MPELQSSSVQLKIKIEEEIKKTQSLRERLQATGVPAPNDADRGDLEKEAILAGALYLARQNVLEDGDKGTTQEIAIHRCCFHEKFENVLFIDNIPFFSGSEEIKTQIKKLLESKDKDASISFSWEVENGQKVITEVCK